MVILGGGIGGVAAARFLRGELERAGLDVPVTLVTDSPVHYMPPLFFDVAIGEAGPGEAWVPLERLEPRFGVRLVVDPVERIDAAERRVALRSGRAIEYDYLVVSLGTTMEWDRYPGLARAGLHSYTLEAALEMRRALRGFRGGTLVVLVPETPHRCGIYPYEAATVLASTFRRRGLRARVVLLTPEERPAAALGEDVRRMWLEAFEEYGVEVVSHGGLEEVDPERRVVRAGGVEERYDLLVKVPPPGLPAPLRASPGFQDGRDPRWAPVRGPFFRHPEYDEVYLVGEHSMAPAGLGLAGVFVHNASLVASQAIIADIAGFYPQYRFPASTCAGYVGDRAFTGHCEPRYDWDRGRYEWRGRCYLGVVSTLARLFKQGFYRIWLDTLR